MVLKLINNTASIKTYASGLVTLPANGNVTVIASLQLATAIDGNLFVDVQDSNVSISDNVNSFVVSDGLVYLNRIVLTQPSINDASGVAITSTLFGAKQRLDVDTASEGTDGSTAPTIAIQVAGKDGSGNLQALLTDTTGALFVTDRIALTGASPTAVTVGVASGLVITSNTARRGLVLTNTSIGIVSFNIVGGSAVLRSGITLYPGGHWEMDGWTFTTGVINGIASVAGCNVAIQELT